jgi:hypothetical protein
MKYHFYGNTTDLYTNVLERAAVHKDPSKTITNEWQSYIR